MTLERAALERKGYATKVIDTLMASHKLSTRRFYASTWRKFSFWCLDRGISPLGVKTKQLLSFLQDGLELGLRTNTLRHQLAALHSVRGMCGNNKVTTHPNVKRFIKGVHHINPPVVHCFPSWDLHLFLQAFTQTPYEPLFSISLSNLTLKTIFLMAVTSTRQVSELGALLVNPILCLFHEDKVVLRPEPSFIPKINMWFHSAQEIVLPSHLKEKEWHMVDVRRVLKYYLKCTKPLCQTYSLFILFRGPAMGKKASIQVVETG